MAQGLVKWFNDVKGYGFIVRDDGEDVFVHHTAVFMQGHRTLKEGQSVSFDVTMGEGGLRATDVRVITAKVKIGNLKAPTFPPSKQIKRPAPKKPTPKPVYLSPPPVCVGKKTSLMIAVQQGDYPKVVSILASGVNPNEQEHRGVTALMFAACRGDLNIVVALINAGANPVVEAYTGDTALSIAYDRKQRECASILSHVSSLHKRYRFTGPKPTSNNSTKMQQETNGGGVFDNFQSERWESSEGLGHMRRDASHGGEFGSFSLHEDYSDEGQADGARDNEWYDR